MLPGDCALSLRVTGDLSEGLIREVTEFDLSFGKQNVGCCGGDVLRGTSEAG